MSGGCGDPTANPAQRMHKSPSLFFDILVSPRLHLGYCDWHWSLHHNLPTQTRTAVGSRACERWYSCALNHTALDWVQQASDPDCKAADSTAAESRMALPVFISLLRTFVNLASYVSRPKKMSRSATRRSNVHPLTSKVTWPPAPQLLRQPAVVKQILPRSSCNHSSSTRPAASFR